jgi:DNA-binding CsgD family transcriptional regulator
VRARSASAPAELPLALASVADLDFRTGRWPAAYAGATESMRLAADTRQTSVLAYSLLGAARIEAAQGRDQECRGHVERALEAALAAGTASTPLFAHSTLGFLELGLGEPNRAAAELEQAGRIAAELGVGQPTVAQSGADLVEAYARAGRRTEAEQALETFTGEAERTGRAWARAATARCRGLLAGDDFEDAFTTALEWHERTPTPFERARTELVLGERLRRAKRRSDAREWLRRALETFERLGAVAWADRARTELHATGETLRRRDETSFQHLTPQELQVALLVSEGATNREAGTALFLSPKTIERHLSHIYRKLNVRSRTELARAVASETSVVRAGEI